MTITQLALNAEQLLAMARSHTGVDLVDHHAHPYLASLLTALNNDSGLHAAGAQAMQEKLLGLLSNRLRMQRDMALHPDILEQVIRPPVVICGAARTGTTRLQQLLAATGDFNALPFWQVLNPSLITGDRDESTAPRIAEAESFIRQFSTASPDTQKAHQFEAHGVEEDSLLLEQSLNSPSFSCWSQVAGYERTLHAQTLTEALRYLKMCLQYLQWQGLASAKKRWLLKSPWYFGAEAAVLAVFPHAQLLTTHRDPGDVLPSMLHLLTAFYRVYSNQTPNTTQWVMAYALAAKNHLQARDQTRSTFHHDVLFETLINKAQLVIEGVYDFINEPLIASSQSVLGRAGTASAYEPQIYRRDRSDFGLSGHTLKTLFAEYLDFLATLKGNEHCLS